MGNFERRMSGTSQATAIMAGVAGLIVEFSRMRAVENNVREPERLLTEEGMKAVLKLAVDGGEQDAAAASSRYLHVKPWVLLKPQRDNNPLFLVNKIEEVLPS